MSAMGLRSRRRSKADGDDRSRWLTTYADLVTLLLAFFVLLFTMSEIDATKFREMLDGLSAPFGNTGMQSDVLDGGATITSEQALEDHTVLSLLDDSRQPDAASEATEEPEDPEDPPQLDDLSELRVELETALDAAELDHLAEVEGDPRGLVVSIGTDSVLFETGSTRISPAGAEILAVVAGPIRSIHNEVLVEGHADTVPISRTDYDNWNLAADRAIAVVRMLTDDHGLAPQRLAATGYGEHRPRAANTTAEGRRRNRRVDILITTDETTQEDRE